MPPRNPTIISPTGKIARQYDFARWEQVKPAVVWKQGQHVLCVGGTGSGKSTVAGEFLSRRAQVCVCVSKGMDDIFDGPYYRDYERILRWPPEGRWWERKLFVKPPSRVLLWPPNARTIRETRKSKKLVFIDLFDNVLLERGNWCIDVDETHYMSSTLGLEPELTDLLEQGRSAGISMWNNTQRPADISLANYVNASHAFLFSSQEEYDVRRLGRMGNKHTTMYELMTNLERLDSFATHEHIYLDRSGRIPPVRSIVNARKR